MSATDEKQYWNGAAKDPEVDTKYIASASVSDCLDAVATISQVFNFTQNVNILDIGCGVGRLAIPIANKYPQYFVRGVDISKEMVKIAKKRFKDNSIKVAGKTIKNFDATVTDGRTIPYKDNTFMAAYSVLVFQHIPNEAKESYINEAYRVLQQGGIFRFQFVEDAESGPVSYGISRDEITTMCEYAGFVVDQIDSELIYPNWVWITCIKT